MEERGVEVGAFADGEHVVQPGELLLDLVQPGLVRHEEQDAAGGAVAERHTDDGVEVEGAAGEEPDPYLPTYS